MVKKTLSLVMAALTLNLSVFAGVPLQRGTQVPVRITADVNSKTTTMPSAIVDKDVVASDGTVLIKYGTPVEVQYTGKKARGCGKPGSIVMDFVATSAVDGQRIALQGVKVNAEGQSKKGVALGVGLGLGLTFVWPCLFVLCKKGGQAIIPANTTYYSCGTATDYSINAK